MPGNTDLPIYDIRDELRTALQTHTRFVLEAPTGSGKSTQVSQMLLDDGLVTEGEIVVLQPRRVAARLLAKRVAEERGGQLGGEVGYQVRFDSKVSKQTRIRYITEGLLLRQLLKDDSLGKVGAVIFDEFHERHLHGDVGLALTRWLQQERRPDLLIGVMSATLDAEGLVDYLQPCAHLSSEGRTYPVDIQYAGNPRKMKAHTDDPWEMAAAQFNHMVKAGAEGDFLIFMPGAYEIRKTIEAITGTGAAREFNVLPLHGELPPEQQDAAVGSRGEKRKCVVSTNVAETSLTIDGVRNVIDAGLARIPAFDPRRGINTLLVEKISQASSDQRAGRAGRTAPGTCVRLWSEADHNHRPPRELPEIRRVDLSEILLTLLAVGIDDITKLPWYESPDVTALGKAKVLLRDLGAVDRGVQITEVGQRMANFPLHPRYARLFIAASEAGCLQPALLVAAFAQERNFILPLDNKIQRQKREDLLQDDAAEKSDFIYMLRAWELARSKEFDHKFCRQWGIHGQVCRQATRSAQQYLQIAQQQGLDTVSNEWNEADLRKCLLLAFSDQLAKRRDRGTLNCALVHKRSGEVRRQSVVRQSHLLVSAEIEERDVRGEVSVLLGMNTAIEERWLREFYPEEFEEESETAWHPTQRRVYARTRKTFRELVLEENEDGEPDADKAATILAEQILAKRIDVKAWGTKVEDWIERVNFLAKHAPEYEIEAIGEDDLKMILEQFCYGCVSHRDVRDKDPWPALKDWLTPEQLPLIDSLAPTQMVLSNGKKVRVRYERGAAIVSGKLQHFYDVEEQPSVCHGAVKAKVELLAPNQRPCQLTEDLPNFWKTSYEGVKKELKGRYPKHEWR